jgi:hypothetical protein
VSGYAPEAFERSRVLFEQVVAELTAQDSDEQTHAQLEEQVGARGRELMRQLYQDHLDLRASREQRAERVVDAEQVVRTRVERDHQRRLATVFGQVTVSRMAYRALGARNLYPTDASLSLPAGLYSDGVRKLVVVESVRGSFEAAAAALQRATGVAVGKRQVEALAQAAAVDIEAFYSARRPPTAGADQLLVMSFDGKGIVMIPAALRQATAKAAERNQQKLATRLSPGEKQGRKRMAELAAVYDATPVPRTPADVIGRPAAGGQRQRGPKATGKWLTGSVVDDIATVIGTGFDEAVRRDPQQQRTWVVLVDGNRTQIEAITTEAARRGVKVHILLDFVHVLEYLWKAAWVRHEAPLLTGWG